MSDTTVTLSPEQFRRRYRWLVLATWTLPVIAGTSFEIFLGLIDLERVLRNIFAGPGGIFVVVFLVGATLALDRMTRRTAALAADIPGNPAVRIDLERAARNLLIVHATLFLLYNLLGPQTALLSRHLHWSDADTATNWLNLLIGILPPILLISVPLFFVATDLLGRFLAPRGVALDLASLRVKYAVLGLVTPALVDITLILYFWRRTGYFTVETLLVWTALLLVAALGTLLAWRSLQHGLQPLHDVIRRRDKGEAAGQGSTAQPVSLDELGALAHEWNRASEKERLQEARFRDLVEGSIQGIFVVRDLRVVFANDAFVTMMGFSSARDILDLPDSSILIAPADRQRIAEYAQAHMEGREAPERFELRVLRADGREVWHEAVARPIRWDGNPALQVTSVDITDRKTAELSLAASEARFRDLVEGSIQGIFIHRDFKPVFANQALADMLGYDSPDAILALPSVLDFVHPDEHGRTTGYKRRRLAGGEAPKRYEMRAVRRDGTEIWLENSSRAIEWQGGQVIQGTVVDISERKRAEQALRESESRFRDLVEGSIQGVLVHRDFRPVFANQALAEMLGYDSPDALLALPSILDFLHPDEHARAARYKDRRLEGKEAPVRYELRALRQDGEGIWLENVARIIEWGGAPAIQATFIDITERKQAENSLKRSEESLRNAQRIARIGSWDWNIADDVLRWSDEIYRILGAEPGVFRPTNEAFLRHVHPDDRETLERATSRALAGEAPFSIDYRIVLADGTVRSVHEEAETIRGPAGEPVRMAGTMQDVSELRQAEEALRASEASLRNAQRIAHIGSWERDIASDRLTWSDQMYELFGMDRATDIPTFESFLARVHPDDQAPLRTAVADALAGTARYDTDFRVCLDDGLTRTIHAQGEVSRDEAGNPVTFSGTAQDVTALRAAEAAVRHLNEELEERVKQRTRELHEAQAELLRKERLATLGQLTATVSHELRNPLGAMRTSLYVLSKTIDDSDERAHRAIGRVERSIARCDTIIDELLDFTRAREIDRRPTAFDPWLEEVLDEMALPDDVTVTRDFDGPPGEVMIDPSRLRRLVINLVDNAAQAMAEQERREVAVSTRVAGGRLELRVADRGPGIDDDTLPHIFEPLYSTKSFGVGLGLPTVQHIAEQHRGTVTVERTGPGGTVFLLSLPMDSGGEAGGGDG